MRYMFLIYGDEKHQDTMTEAERGKLYADYGAYTTSLAEAGIMRGGGALKPSATATTVRVRGGRTSTTDGPFAETKEQFGGFYIVECPNLDEALRWAAKMPTATYGSVEVRPMLDVG